MGTVVSDLEGRVDAARQSLDACVREVVAWHFDPATGCPFWLEWAQKAGWDPRTEIHGFGDLRKFGHFEDEWLRGGPVRRWVPKAYADRPIYVFETGGTTGIPRAASRSTTSGRTTSCSRRPSPRSASRRAPTG